MFALRLWIAEVSKQSDHPSARVGMLTQLVTSTSARAVEQPRQKSRPVGGPACAEGATLVLRGET